MRTGPLLYCATCSDFFIKHSQYQKAVELLVAAKKLSEAPTIAVAVITNSAMRFRSLWTNLKAEHRLYEEDPAAALLECESLLEEDDLDPAVRVGDVFGFLVEHHCQLGNYQKAWARLEELRRLYPSVNVSMYVSQQSLEALQSAAGIRLRPGDSTRRDTDNTRTHNGEEEEEEESQQLAGHCTGHLSAGVPLVLHVPEGPQQQLLCSPLQQVRDEGLEGLQSVGVGQFKPEPVRRDPLLRLLLFPPPPPQTLPSAPPHAHTALRPRHHPPVKHASFLFTSERASQPPPREGAHVTPVKLVDRVWAVVTGLCLWRRDRAPVQKEMEAEEPVSSAPELKDHIRFLTDENVQLRSKLGSFQSKVAQQASSTRDLSTKLVQSEEDKLKNMCVLQISRDLVDSQIEANKLREKYEEEIFELKNKATHTGGRVRPVLSQDGVISSVEAECERLQLEGESLKVELAVTQGQGRELEEEHGALKSNFLSVSEALEREISHSDELSEELLTLAHTHDTLLRERQRAHKHTLEVERVRALLSSVSHHRVRPEELNRGAFTDRHAESQTGTQNGLREELERMRKSYEEQQRRLEEKIVALGKDQQENMRAIRNTQQELAQQSAALISSQFQLKEVEAENSKLQNHLKELNQEYRARLTHYIHDITECASGVGEGDVGVRLKEFVDSMFKEVRGSYRSREEQLTSTVRTYRKRLQKLSTAQQQLLIAYRMQREQILAHPCHGLEAGPPEATFSPGESEIRGDTERELQRLREDKERLEKELQAAQEQVLSEEAWTDIRNQLRDAVNTTQEAQERERLQLISRAVLAEQQVCELQEYVDNHLGRYKLEITRLQRMLGLEGARSQSAELPKPRPLPQSLRNTSNEA
ncbi:hypothetical protein NFI96_017046 [Prochilodus magdalenae]|nr:hypothetical protein NFI96_017046 [Prochilodus magdalenae]